MRNMQVFKTLSKIKIFTNLLQTYLLNDVHMLARLSQLLGGTKPNFCQEQGLVFHSKHKKYTVQFP